MSRVSTLQAKALFIHGWYNKGIRVYNHIVKWVNVSGTAGFRADPQKAMAQTASLKIIEFIRGGDRCVCEIFPATGEELSNTWRHLNMMQAAGVLPRRKDGLKIFYAIKHPKILEIADTLALIAKHEFGGGHELLKVVRADLPDREDPSFRQNLNALEDIMKIELLCTSCARCTSLYENVRKAIEESGKKVELVKVEDIPSITKYGVMSMPALVIDGQVKFSGKVASVAEIKEML